MSKEYYRKRIADKRIEIVSLRAKIAKIKEEKKRRMLSLSNSIKATTAAATKETYRKQKISESEKFVREEESIKNKIEAIKHEIDGLKKSLANCK